MKRMSLMVSLVAVSVAAGCGPVKVLELDKSMAREAKPSDCKIEPFFNTAPSRPHEVFGEIRYSQTVSRVVAGVNTNNGSRREALQALSEKACELGADAILITDENHDKSGMTATLLAFTDV